MLTDYGEMVKTCYLPLIKEYGLEFVAYDGDEFFLLGSGFGLYVFIDRMDRRGDTWYVSLTADGRIKDYTLRYIMKERLTQEDREAAGAPQTIDEHIEATFKILCVGLMRHCPDILSGDRQWLQGYPHAGDYNRRLAQFLAPYFRRQGYYVAQEP